MGGRLVSIPLSLESSRRYRARAYLSRQEGTRLDSTTTLQADRLRRALIRSAFELLADSDSAKLPKPV